MPAQDSPQELLCHIVGNLHDDKESLRHCSFVCRSWSTACGYYLFRSLCLRRPTRDTCDENACQSLLRLLAGSRRLSGSVTELVIDGFKAPTFESAVLSLRILGDIIAQLPRLQDLHLRKMIRMSQEPLTLPPLTATLPRNIRYLELQDSVIFARNPYNFATLLGLFDSIEDLSITLVSIWGSSTEQSCPKRASATHGTSIRKLSIRAMFDADSCAVRNILEVIAESIEPGTAKQITVDPFEPVVVPALSELLCRCSNLSYLCLAFGKQERLGLTPPLDLGVCRFLRDIHFTRVKQRLSPADREDNICTWETMCGIIAKAPPSVENVALELEIAEALMPPNTSPYALYDWSLLDEISWEKFDAALTALDRLSQVHILNILRHRRGSDVGARILAQLSPRLRPVVKYEARHEIYTFIDPTTGYLRVITPETEKLESTDLSLADDSRID